MRFQLLCLFQNACLVHGNGKNDDLDGGDLGRQDEAVVVAVRHDDGADHAGGGAPGGLEGILELVVAAGEGHVVGTGELVAEVVAGRALKGLVILHEAFDGVGRFGAGELFFFGLLAGNDGDGENILKEVGIAAELLLGLVLRFLGRFMDGVALLPPELSGAQERAGRFFPADDGAPLVIEHRQLAVGLQNAGPVVAEHRLGGRTERKALLELFAAAHRDPRHLGREAVDQLAFLFQQAFRNQDGHRHVLMAGLFELGVHDALNVLPDGIAIRPQDGKALDGCILDQLRLAADIGVPLGKIDLHIGDLLHFLLFRHIGSSFRKYFFSQ